MIDFIRDFFNKISEQGFSDNEQEKFQQIRIATCALLLEMATIDGEFSEAEKTNIINILKREYELSEEDVDFLIHAATEQLEGSIDLWRFTNLINQHSSMEQKLQIIEMVWQIAYTDGKLDQHEDYLVHKLATLLRLTHHELIQAKLKVILPR
ncbi:TerB family tellurite resistance protein [Desulfoferrobacter suflitae]|uniref:tellurite resistance TerB family protein n=1 Tax=Desulfoferrobacter suflitae TaxID=2865782 RepID=UPI00216499BC|nr:TerB family tellurite resistance protein [Desulfoferrobacter suflitae]MCK8601601.1 TerB family tellurite resistance protein [Desulfoferrobacter suflitae]